MQAGNSGAAKEDCTFAEGELDSDLVRLSRRDADIWYRNGSWRPPRPFRTIFFDSISSRSALDVSGELPKSRLFERQGCLDKCICSGSGRNWMARMSAEYFP